MPRYPGASKIFLLAVDRVYLQYHQNLYHGWIWHWPYFDCSKAVKLADRAMEADPDAAEEALWTKIFCYRVRGLDGNVYPYNSSCKEYPTVRAQVRWKSDPEQVRRFCREIQTRFPTGKHTDGVAELIEMKEVELTLPDSWGAPVPAFKR